MGIIKRWNEISEAAGEFTGDTALELAKGVRNKVCEFYNAYPNNWVMPSYSRGFLKAICREDGGGGGAGLGLVLGSYEIRIQLEYFPRFATEPVQFEQTLWSQNVPYQGSIDKIEPEPPTESQLIDHRITDINGNELLDTSRRVNLGSGARSVPETIKYFIKPVNVVEPPPDTIPPGAGDTTINITNNQEGNSFSEDEYNLTIPVINNTLAFPVTVNVGGVDINLDLDGVKVGDEVTTTPPPDATTKEPFMPEEFDKTGEQMEDTEELEVNETELKYVLIFISQKPISGKQILQPSIADSTFFAGYFSWTIDVGGVQYRSTEEPVRKERQYFKAPIDATGFRVYTVNGAKLQAEWYSVKSDTTVGG